MSDKHLPTEVDDILLDVNERLKRTRENLRKLREGSASAPLPAAPSSPSSLGPASPLPRQVERRPGTDGWEGRLMKFADEIATLNRGTEGEFLYMGSSLQDFYNRARKTSDMSKAVARMVSDKDVEDTIRGLGGLLDRMKEHLDCSGKKTERLSERLRHAVDAIDRSQSPDASDKTASLRLVIGNTLTALQRIQSRQKEKGAVVIEKTAQSLDSLKSKHAQAAVALDKISKTSEVISRAMGEVVESLQFHDITRQEIEHARASIAASAAKLKGTAHYGQGAPALLPAETVRLVGEACDDCELQSARLSHARDELKSAVEVVAVNLRELAKGAVAVSEETRVLTRGDKEAGKSFLTELGFWLSTVSATFSVFSENAEINREVATAVAAVSGAARDLSERLKSAGASGGGNGRVAGILGELAALGELGGHGHDEGREVNLGEFVRIGGELNTMLGALRGMNGKVLCNLSLMDEAGRTLSDDIEKVVAGTTVHLRVSKAVDEVKAGLEGVIAEIRRVAPASDKFTQAARLREAARHTAPRGRVRGTGTDGYAVDDFGDNVEIF